MIAEREMFALGIVLSNALTWFGELFVALGWTCGRERLTHSA